MSQVEFWLCFLAITEAIELLVMIPCCFMTYRMSLAYLKSPPLKAQYEMAMSQLRVYEKWNGELLLQLGKARLEAKQQEEGT